MLKRLGPELRHAFRSLRRSPLFCAAIVATLALGYAATTTVFSIIYATVLKPLPYRDAGQLVAVTVHNTRQQVGQSSISAGEYAALTALPMFSRSAYSTDTTYTVTGDGDAATLVAYQLSPNFPALMGVRPALGRDFQPEEGVEGNDTVVLLSDRLWRRRYGASPDILNRVLTLDGRSFRVIGVMPPEFQHPAPNTDVWTPMVLSGKQAQTWDPRFLRVLTRLPAGTAPDGAKAELSVLSSMLQASQPKTNREWTLDVQGLREMYVGQIRTPILILQVGALLSLLIACASQAGLFLSRAFAQQKQFAVRMALGSGRLGAIAPLFAESVMLSLAGAIAGLALAYYALAALPFVVPKQIADIVSLVDIRLGGPIVAATLALSLVMGFVVAAVPALRALSAKSISGTLADTGRTKASASSRQALRSVLIVAEVALSVLLLLGASLMIRSMARLQGQPLGIETGRAAVVQVTLPMNKFGPGRSQLFIDDVIGRLKALPGVEAAGATNVLPMSGMGAKRAFRRDTDSSDGPKPLADFRLATPDYFRAMGMTLLAGRTFTDADRAGAPEVVIVNESLANVLGRRDLIGRRLISGDFGQDTPKEIVGIVGDVRDQGFDSGAKPAMYRPFAQSFWPYVGFAVRATGDPSALTRPAMEAIWAVDKDLPVDRAITMEAMAADTLALRRLVTLLLSGFGAVGLVLAVLALYGTIAYEVGQRGPEIAIRRALGAQSSSILWLIGRHGIVLLAIGQVLGVAGGLLSTRALSRLLFDTPIHDPATFTAVVVIVTCVSVTATLVPPLVAIRREVGPGLRVI